MSTAVPSYHSEYMVKGIKEKLEQRDCLTRFEEALLQLLPSTEFLKVVQPTPQQLMTKDSFLEFIQPLFSFEMLEDIEESVKELAFLEERGYRPSIKTQACYLLSSAPDHEMSNHPDNYVSVFEGENGTVDEVLYSIDEQSNGELGEIFIKSVRCTYPKGLFHRFQIADMQLMSSGSEAEGLMMRRMSGASSNLKAVLVNLNAGVEGGWPVWYPLQLLYAEEETRMENGAHSGFPYPNKYLVALIKSRIAELYPNIARAVETDW